MSLVPSYVRLGNLWFEGPVIYDESENWFICFDDDDPVEIVIKIKESISNKDAIELILDTLGNAKINAEIIMSKGIGRGCRNYPKTQITEYHESIWAFIELKQNIEPNNLKVDHKGISHDLPPTGEFVAYDFNPTPDHSGPDFRDLGRLSKWLNPFGE